MRVLRGVSCSYCLRWRRGLGGLHSLESVSRGDGQAGAVGSVVHLFPVAVHELEAGEAEVSIVEFVVGVKFPFKSFTDVFPDDFAMEAWAGKLCISKSEVLVAGGTIEALRCPFQRAAFAFFALAAFAAEPFPALPPFAPMLARYFDTPRSCHCRLRGVVQVDVCEVVAVADAMCAAGFGHDFREQRLGVCGGAVFP